MVKINKIDDITLYKKKGQHILMDEEIIHRQIVYAEISKSETVLEIGPGLGALTFKLAQKAKKVVAIERDQRLFLYLKEKVPENVDLICADVLKTELPEFDVVVSNLPYQISSPVTFKLLNHDFNRAILMYQEEFANRMVAKYQDKEYSRLSVNVYFLADCRILETVPKKAFYPEPKVNGAIVKLVPREPPFSVKDEKMFFKVVNSLFAQKRKKIKNSLMSLISAELKRQGVFSKHILQEITNKIPYRDERVKELSPEKIAQLSDVIHTLLKNTSNSA